MRLHTLLLLLSVGAACVEQPKQEISIPDGLDLKSLDKDVRQQLRATIEVDQGSLNETEVTLHAERGTIEGDFALQSVTKATTRTLTLRVYGRTAAAADEVLLGSATTSLSLAPGEATYVAFPKGDGFVTCDAGADERCALLFDENRNGHSNIDDLHARIDPAPQPLTMQLSPSTLQFPSGIGLGDFARQVVILENLGDGAVRVDSVEVIDAPGVGLSEIGASGEVRGTPRRHLDAADFPEEIPAHGELLLAVSFAPVNAFLATGAVQAVITDVGSGVQQGVRTKIIANSDGDLRPPDPGYQQPADANLSVPGSDAVAAHGFPSASLSSGLAVLSADPAAPQSGLPRGTGAQALLSLSDGSARVFLIDAAYLVDVPVGFRFSTALGGLGSDVDLAVLRVDAGALGDLACGDACLSDNANDSDEAVEFENSGDGPLSVAVVLSRIEIRRPPLGSPGAATDVGDAVPFELVARVHQGPEFDDDAPIAPLHGPVEGGNTVTLRGRGFQDGARVTFSGLAAVDVAYDVADPLHTVITCKAPPGTLDVDRNPATIVVLNPARENGGDEQAATLPQAYRFDPPAPRLEEVTPAFAPADAPQQVVQIRGAFFSTRFGPPVVAFGAVTLDASLVEGHPELIEVLPPPSPTPTLATTTGLRVQNRIAYDEDEDEDGTPDTPVLGIASNTLVFSYVLPVGPAPTLSAISPAEGSVDGLDAITLTGTNFRTGAVVSWGATLLGPFAASNNGTEVHFISPGGDNGDVQVGLVNPDGQPAADTVTFSYQTPPPAIDDVQPPRTSNAGGAVLIVSGSGFRAGALASFNSGATAIPAVSTVFASSTLLLVTTPPLQSDSWQLRVVNPDQASDSFDIEVFTPVGPAPTVESVLPATDLESGGATARVLGRDIDAGAVLAIGASTDVPHAFLPEGSDGVPAGLVALEFVVPPSPTGAGTVLLQVQNDDFQTATTVFTYLAEQDPSPRIATVQPAFLTEGELGTLFITGANFDDDALVFVGGTIADVATPHAANALHVSLRTPLPAGNAVLEVRNPDGQSASATLPVLPLPPPPGVRIDHLTPATLAFNDTAIDVVGAGFDANTKVLLDGAELLPDALTASFIHIKFPETPAAGLHLITVIGGDGSIDDETFLVTPPPDPRVTPVHIDHLSKNTLDPGETTLSLFGSGFADGTEVTVDGAPVEVTSLTDVRIDLALPPELAPGLHVVLVRGANGTADSAAFLVRDSTVGTEPPPRIEFLDPFFLESDDGVVQVQVQGQALANASLTFNGQLLQSFISSDTNTSFFVNTTALGEGSFQVVVARNGASDRALLTILTPGSGPPVTAELDNVQPQTFVDNDQPLTFFFAGSNLATVGQVTFDGAPLVVHDIQGGSFQADLPLDVISVLPGLHALRVQTAAGFVGADVFVVEPPVPHIENLLPTTIPAGSPQRLTLTGTNLTTNVTLDEGVLVTPPSLAGGILAIDVNGMSAGLHVVTVSNSAGADSAVVLVTDGNVSLAPRVTSFDPAEVLRQNDPTFTLTVSGSDLDSITSATLAGNGVTITPISDTELTLGFNPSSFSLGLQLLTLSGPEGNVTVSVPVVGPPPPRIDSITPTSAQLGAGVIFIDMVGAGLVPTQALLDGAFIPYESAPPPTSSSATLLVDIDALGLGTHIIEVQSLNDLSQSDFAIFDVFDVATGPGPSIHSVTPGFVTATRTSRLTINGANFDPGATVTVGGVSATVVGTPTTNQFTVDVNASGPPGLVQLELVNPDGQRATLQVERRALPTVTGLSRDSARQVGGDVVTVLGQNLDLDPASNVSVRIVGTPDVVTQAVGGTVTSTSFDFVVPSGLSAGVHNLFVRPTAGLEVVAPSLQIRAPEVFNGQAQLQGSDVRVTFSGRDLAGTVVPSAVNVGANVCAIDSASDAQIQCTLSLNAAAWGQVRVATVSYPGGTSVTANVVFPLLQIAGFSVVSGDTALPARVDLSRQTAERRSVRVLVDGFNTINLPVSSHLLIEAEQAPPAVFSSFDGTQPIFVYSAGALPAGVFKVQIVSGPIVMAEGGGLIASAPAMTGTPGAVEWSTAPGDASVSILNADSADIVAQHETIGLSRVVTSTVQGPPGTVRIDTRPMAVGSWRFCFIDPLSGGLFGCSGSTTQVGAPLFEEEGNNTDTDATAMGLTPGINPPPGRVFGDLFDDARDRFFVAAQANSRLLVNVLPDDLDACRDPSRSITVKVRPRGTGILLASSSSNGSLSCGQIGLAGEGLVLPEGEFIVELSRNDLPVPYSVVASVIPPSEPTCGDGVAREGEESSCETGGPPQLCFGADGEATCNPNNCLLDFSACGPLGGGDNNCGNGIRDGDEACDINDFGVAGATCGDFFSGASGLVRCTLNCQLDTSLCMAGAVCGNGIVEGNEQCDDGDNGDDDDGCTRGCLLNQCGDRVVQAGEECDDGNLDTRDGCDNRCRLFGGS